ncbi:hypothetical protein GT370_13700 [Acidocella sp. MX-AZ03]|uniref:hypothetical protein n=1 Tax=Acidocella sp. MX-AZ03 TaxID=2697363 RepID=UPI0022DE7916|nr:hypothetical protein [Acidocella sp. MX-AZ03]WBO58256.1 hypothetical protein GT370_13700 [Acidocella sp. MX-AZ03]
MEAAAPPRAEGHADEGDEGAGAGAIARKLRQRVGEEQNHHHRDQDGQRRADAGTGGDQPETKEKAHRRGDVGEGGGNDLRKPEAVTLEAFAAPRDCAHYFMIPAWIRRSAAGCGRLFSLW